MNANAIQGIDIGFRPRKHQDFIYRCMKRFNVFVCHRRFGKTLLGIAYMIHKGLKNMLKKPQYAFIGPNYGQVKRVAWEYLKEFTKMFPGVKVNETELRIDIPRGDDDFVRFMLLGSENPNSIRGVYLDGAILDEYSECDPSIWTYVVRAALSDRLGWAIFLGTPKGENHFKRIFDYGSTQEHWYTAMFRASETGIISESELRDAKGTMGEEEYEQEFECSWAAAMRGAYYGRYIIDLEENNHITRVPHDPILPVHTYWDIGIDDSTAIWMTQELGREVRVIDYLESSDRGLEWYTKELHKKPYNFGNMVLPHDGKAREFISGISREDALRDLGFHNVYCLERTDVGTGIQAVRQLLPKCYFDAQNTVRGIMALKNYSRKWDPKTESYSSTPTHNWACHGADAFRTFAMGRGQYTSFDEWAKQQKIPQKYMEADNTYDPFAV